MNNRREMVLREMELTPVWKGRGQESGVRSQESGIRSEESGISDQTSAVRKAPAMEVPAEPVAPDLERRTIILKMDWPALQGSVAGCVACDLHKARTRTVFGVGDEHASWLFIGEGPGADEDQQGEPFVGQAGKLLDNMLAAIDLKRGDDVYIANIVKCRPPKNRNPQPGEAMRCEPYLNRQIGLIEPKIIVALGKVAAQNLLGTDAAVGSLRGRLHAYGDIALIVTYHPAYLLRSPADKARVWEDLCFARARMRDLKSVQVASS